MDLETLKAFFQRWLYTRFTCFLHLFVFILETGVYQEQRESRHDTLSSGVRKTLCVLSDCMKNVCILCRFITQLSTYHILMSSQNSRPQIPGVTLSYIPYT